MSIIVTCPHCGAALGRHENVGPSHVTPTPGRSAVVCWCCGGVSVFDLGPVGDMTLRPPTVEEQHTMAGNPALVAALRAVREQRESPSAAVAQARRDTRTST